MNELRYLVAKISDPLLSPSPRESRGIPLPSSSMKGEDVRE